MGTIKTPARVWLLIEYTGPWRERAIEDNDLPEAAQAWLRHTLAAHPEAKALFVKQPEGQNEGVRLTVAETDTGRMWRMMLADHAGLPRVDLGAVLGDDPAEARFTGPLMVVCTNGKRDACCAKYGLATYHALRELAPFEVWQSTHITGHRYAATGIAFPAGVFYGRMENAAGPIVQAVEAGRIALPHYRGRAHYPRPAQIADALLRDALTIQSVEGLRLEQAPTAFSADTWQATFATPDGRKHRVTVTREQIGEQTASHCSTPEAVPVFAYNLARIDTLRG